MSRVTGRSARGTHGAAKILTFLIADVRGYTAFTQAQGDEAAGRLAATFAEIAREGVEARGGEVIELRGDEALAVFSSARQAIRAAVELQEVFADETERDSSTPLRVGIGLDAGEAVPVEDGYRGGALNLAARLCSRAGPFEVLASEGVHHLARAVEGVRFEDLGALELKGLAEPVAALRIVPDVADREVWRARVERLIAGAIEPRPQPLTRGELPPELDPGSSVLAGRDRDLRWLRWTWRRAHRGEGRVVMITGSAGVGKTRLVAELAVWAHSEAATVSYVGTWDAEDRPPDLDVNADLPRLIVLDDVDRATPTPAFASLPRRVAGSPVLVVAMATDPNLGASAVLSRELDAADRRELRPLDADGVRRVAVLYTGLDRPDLPVADILRDTGGLPLQVLRAVGAWASREATRRLGQAAGRAAAGRTDLRAVEAELAGNVVDLQLVRERARVLGGAGAAEGDEGPPFKGLETFGIGDAELFFGRERLVAEMVARLAGSTLLGVVGPSGSGKSSALRAGLVPALESGVLLGSSGWLRAVMRPGPSPLRELDRTVWAAFPERIRTRLAGSDLPFREVRAVLENDERVLLVVDQFEELFTACGDEDERSAFVRALTEAARDPGGRAVVTIALRADFYGRCAAYSDLADLLAGNHVLVGPMTAEEYRRAIELPAARAGVRFDRALTDAMVEQVLGEPGALPLLSTALLELWGRREGRTIGLAAYAETGGVRGAVARLAEAAYASLSEEDRGVARGLLLRLAGPGEGEAVVRRRVPLAEFDVEQNPGVARVLAVLTARRLVTVSEGTAEVAHEALLREWPRLQTWLEQDREGQRLHSHMIEAAREWAAAGREPGELYRGARLASALDWTTEHTLELNELERDFVTESRAAADQDADRQRRTNRRLRALLTGLAVFLIVALVAGSLAVVQRGRAQHSATVALSQSLGAKAVAETQLDTALLLAEEGLKLDDSVQTESDLLTVLLHSPSAIHVLHAGTIGATPQALAVSPDGRTLAVVNGGGNLWFHDTSTGRPIGEPVRDVATTGYRLPEFTPSSSELAVLRGTGVQMIDVRTHQVVRTIDVGQSVDSFLSPVLLSPDGQVVYIAIEPNVEAFDTSTGRLLERAEVPGASCQGIAMAQRTGEVVTLTPQGGGRIQIRNGDTLAVERSFRVPVPVPSCGSYTVAVSPDGRTAAYAVTNPGHDESLRFVDLRTGHVRVASGVLAGGDLVAVSPNGRTAISVSDDYLHISVWDVASATVVQTLSGHSGAIESGVFDPSGRTLYSGGDDGNVFVWDLSGSRSFGHAFTVGPGSLHGPGYFYPYFAASPDGKSIAVPYTQHLPDGSNRGGGVNIVDLATGRITMRFQVAGRVPGISSVSYAEFSPDGTELLVSPGPSSNGDITLWRLGHGSPSLVRTFSGLTSTPVPSDVSKFHEAPWATFSPDGKWIAGVDRRADGDSRMIEWDAATGAERAAPLNLPWKSTDGQVSQNVVYSPDGSMIATSVLGDRVVIMDAKTLKPLRTLRDPHGVAFVAFSPATGGLLAEGSADVGIVRLWDVATGKEIAEAGASNSVLGGISSVQFDPTGSMLLTLAPDGVARLWAVPGLQKVGSDLPGVSSFYGAATFAGRGSSTMAVLVYNFGQAFSYHVSLTAWERQGCLVAGRNFTRTEWDLYLPGRPYTKVCPNA